MRTRELRDLSDDELEQKLHDRRQELFNLRFQAATGALENSARLRLAKREIARLLTVRNERSAVKEGARGGTTGSPTSNERASQLEKTK